MFDRSRNVFLLERNSQPVNDQQRMKVQIGGGIRFREEVNRAVFGTMTMVKETSHAVRDEIHEEYLTKQYLHKSEEKKSEEEKADEPELMMIDTEVKALPQIKIGEASRPAEVVRDQLLAALRDMSSIPTEHVIFGSTIGSIGQFT